MCKFDVATGALASLCSDAGKLIVTANDDPNSGLALFPLSASIGLPTADHDGFGADDCRRRSV